MAQGSDLAKSPMATIRDLLTRSKSQIAMALPKHISPDRMLRMTMTSIQRNPRLLECTVHSIIGGVIQSAQLGLELDDIRGEAYLVPFKNNKKNGVLEAQFVAGYKGLSKLAINSGYVRKVEPRNVYEHDEFDYAYGDKPFLRHKPAPSSNRGKLTHTYTVATYKDGTTQFIVLDKDEIDEHKAKSKSRGDNSVWNTDYDSMALKTGIRVLSKYIPASAELQTAAALDERAEEGIPQDLEAVYTEIVGDDDNGKKATDNLGDLTNKLKQDQQPEPKKTEAPAQETKPEPEPKKSGRLF